MASIKDISPWLNPLSDDDREFIWNNGIIVYDTNVLLDLYRYHPETKDKLLLAISSFGERNYITNHVCCEFLRRREGIIRESFKLIKDKIKETEKTKNTTKAIFKSSYGYILDDSKIEEINIEIDNTFYKIESEINSEIQRRPNYLSNDTIFYKINDIFSNRIKENISDEEEDILNKEYEDRLARKIPPGISDNEKENGNRSGDYIIWKQMIDISKESQKNIIFVTSEKKPDWWEKDDKNLLGPKRFLSEEFFKNTNKNILFYQTFDFLETYMEKQGQEKDYKVLKEIKAISKNRYSDQKVKDREQDVLFADDEINSGLLSVSLTKECKNFTVTGSFNPAFNRIPSVDYFLLEGPEGLPLYKVTCGVGTCFNFNIHIMVENKQELLPVGKYIFAYHAISAPDEDCIDDEKYNNSEEGSDDVSNE